MKCGFCGYEWASRVKQPKACPKCKLRFDYEKRGRSGHYEPAEEI